MLSWSVLLLSFLSACWLSARIVFHRKLLFMALGIAVYYAILYAMALFRPGEGFGSGQALYVLVEIPGVVLAIYLTMDLVAGERDRRTLETLFSTSTSHYGIWMMRLLVVYGVLLLTLMVMSALAYVLFAEFPFVWGGLNAFVPAFLIVNLTFFFSVLCRSSNTAGMLALGAIIGVLLSAESLRESYYFLFLNPFNLPMGVDAAVWAEIVLLNRSLLMASGGLLLFLGLRRMVYRERLLS
jgi:ABC-type transport system involved in multi-copper enzyme maturation permease subunit